MPSPCGGHPAQSPAGAWTKSYSRVTPAVPVPAPLLPHPSPRCLCPPCWPQSWAGLGWAGCHSALWHSQEKNEWWCWNRACQHARVPGLAARGLLAVGQKGIARAPCLAQLLPTAGLPARLWLPAELTACLCQLPACTCPACPAAGLPALAASPPALAAGWHPLPAPACTRFCPHSCLPSLNIKSVFPCGLSFKIPS